MSGDGWCDSPGYRAKYETYTLLDSTTDYMAGFTVIQVTDVTSSVAMEKAGLQQTLDNVPQQNFKVDTIAADRHLGIACCMRKQYPNIKHHYDVWHFDKALLKRLTKAANK